VPATTPNLKMPYPLPDDTVDVPRDVKALADALEAGATFIVGEVRFIAVIATPAFWLPADGAALSRTAYAKLFAAIGSAFGAGDGSTTFNVPDLRGRSPVGVGTAVGGGIEASPPARLIGTKWGVNAVALTAAQSGVNGNGGTGTDSPDHVHGNAQNGFMLWRTGDAFGPAAGAAPLGQFTAATTGGASARHAHALTARNADATHENAMPSLAIPAYIYAGA